MTTPRIDFLSYAPEAGGITTYQALQLTYLATRAQLSLIDEDPQTTLGLLAPGIRGQVQALNLPVWSNTRAASAALRDHWRQHPPNVVAVSNPAVLLRLSRAIALARRLGARVVQTVHSDVLTPTWRRRLMQVGAAALSPLVDDQVYVSAYTRDAWQSRFPWLRRAPSRVVPNGVALKPDAATERRRANPPRIGFVGRLQHEKGIDRFLDVARLAGAAGKRWEFHVYGNGPEWPAVMAAGGKVHAHGHVEDVSAIFAALDVLLVTSPVENCPYVVLEAKQAGVPTVAAAVGGLPDIVTHGVDGILTPTRAAADYLLAIHEALLSHARLSAGCLTRCACFAVERQVRTTWEPHMSHAWLSQTASSVSEQPEVGMAP